jgi:hypothetical protein
MVAGDVLHMTTDSAVLVIREAELDQILRLELKLTQPKFL